MSEAEILDILRSALWTALTVSTPILTVALVVGLVIGLAQALTSVQETTLTFVPKLGAILAVFWITMSFSGHTLTKFYQDEIIPRVIGRGADLGPPSPHSAD
ncbi:flagellar biosynthetic protein FliQ [Amaricoccus solimangrovi]|uniref:Flagellar biosynthetic protein FliQ n=1 Tax=Amaricoccus solimangrovi TaxID=2589815 RepID=A0A501X0Q1_9RHOB|nr:flagellar biosynthetic protein FliQ [Amaricoccus solimangrovi]TPE52496.1 flagellar biosynthetic protein FliQ [Amaricoccus solimangrovi]